MQQPEEFLIKKRAIIANALAACLLALAGVAAAAPPDPAQAAYDHGDYAAAAALDAPRAAAGHADAQYRMGMMARFGWGMDKDPAAAARWLNEAAQRDHPQAQFELGTMYRLGRGVPLDPKRAAQLLTSAASAGIGIAQLSIGRMYRDGVGVERDAVEAYAWFSAAGDNSVMDGFAYRAELAKEMTSEQIAEARRLATQRARKETQPR